MSPQEITSLLLLCTAMSFSPGPNTTLSTALAANAGLARTLRFCLAVPVGWVCLMLLCGLGLGALVSSLPALRWGVKGLGVAYLLWLAHKLSHTARLGEADAARLNVSFAQGVLMQFANIKAWLLALTLSGGWVVNSLGAPSTNPGFRLALVCGVMALFAFVSNFSYALMGSMLRPWLAQGARLLWFNRGLALVLVCTAGLMLAV
jgi:threonine/homoserine/homoserine lactone efflux protein